MATIEARGPHQFREPPPSYPCPCSGGRMIVIETFGRGGVPTVPIRIDAS
jgi:hypothetical protein